MKPGRRLLGRLLLAGSFAALTACRNGQSAASGASGQDEWAADARSSASGAVGVPTQSALAPARCRATGRGVTFEGDAGLGDLEIGGAVLYTGGSAIAVIHRAPAGRVGAVVTLGADGGGIQVSNLGPTLGDAPPPRLVACGESVVAAAYEPPSSATGVAVGAAPTGGTAVTPPGDARALVLSRVQPRLQKSFWTISEQRDESLAFDLACSGAGDLVVVWDEVAVTADGGARGVIRIASSEAGHPPSVMRDLSPPESDVELPRVVPTEGGFFVLWIAHRPEPAGPVDASDMESAGEVRAYGWLEVVRVDAAGRTVGSVRRLTPANGHVSSFDVTTHADPGALSHVVVARDDGESAEAAGGALLRIRLRDTREQAAEGPVALVTDGLGRGAPTLLEGASAPWLVWVNPQEQLRLLPLDGAGAPLAAPSAEEALDDAQPLLLAGREGEMLAATPRDSGGQLRFFACRP